MDKHRSMVMWTKSQMVNGNKQADYTIFQFFKMIRKGLFSSDTSNNFNKILRNDYKQLF